VRKKPNNEELRMRIQINTLVTLLLFSSSSLWAQAVLEEVVVTARKTTESLNDVPISVSVTSGERLEKTSIDGLEELSLYIPNVHINQNATQQTVTIRGIGSGANQAFEQSVGTYIDGVYFGRGRSARNPFFDIERVEILKGPQGILFGKNTIAGAINITTRTATDETEGYIAGEYFSGIDQWGVAGAISGPFNDSTRGRLAAKFSSEGGYMNNVFGNADEAEVDEYIVRGSLVFDPTERLEIIVKAEAASYDVKGRTAQNVQAGPLGGLYLAFDPTFESKLNFRSSTPGDDFDNTDTENFTAILNYDVNDNWTLTSITAFVSYDFENNIPAEFAPIVDYAEQQNKQDHDQFSQELRAHFASPDSRFEFVGGLYYQTEELNNEETFNFNLSNLIDLGVPMFPLDSSIITFFSQDTDSTAAFGELRYNITERLQVSAGLRYTKDEKSVDKQLIVATLGTQTPDPSQVPYAAIIGRIPHAYELEREDTDTTPAFGIKFDTSDNSMIYGTYSEGFKSGGFDAQNTAGILALAQFEPENVEAWEIGGKFGFAEGAARINVAYFNNQYTDLQVAAFNGLVFTTTNAASATSRGIEADGQWAATDNLTFGASVAWLDATYDDFANATCTAPQQIAHAAETGRPPGSCTQDLSGRDLQFSPEFAGNFNAEYTTMLANNYTLSIQGNINYSGSYYTAQDLDPLSRQSSYAKLDLRVELADLDGKWSVAAVGKNLTDEKTTTWVNDVPVFRGAYFGFIDPPRSFGIQLRRNF